MEDLLDPDTSDLHESAATSKQDTHRRGHSATGYVEDRNSAISRIERIFEDQVDALLSGTLTLQLDLRRRPSRRNRYGVSSVTETRTGTLQYPGRGPEIAWRYAVTLRILELIHEALITGQTITKREIYYRDPSLFTKQAVVDRYVDDIAFTFSVPRSLLNVTATAKGLVKGAITFRKPDGSLIDGRLDAEGLLISAPADGEHVDITDAKWILVVEKESVFHSLASSCLSKDLKSHGVLLTAKGYPDIATRAFLHDLSVQTAGSSAILGLFDLDPDGIDILATYKHGSFALAHENAGLVVPTLKWIGLHSTVIFSEEYVSQEHRHLRLSARDRHKAVRMLEREPFRGRHQEPLWTRELHVMLMLNVKAEIELLEYRSGGMGSWVQAELQRLHGG